jgi:hypothetical protein
MRMGGMHLGGMRMGGHHVSAFHSAGHGFHVGNRSFAHSGLGAHHFAGSTARAHANANRALGAHNIGAHNLGHAAAAAGAAHLAGRNYAHAGNLNHGPGNWHNNWHGRFPHPFPGFRGWWGVGWFGPVFWPFAYDVIWASLWWPWAYDWPFWAYGYPDIYAGLFWPYGYDDLAGYLPPGPGPIAGGYGGGSYGGVGGPAVAGAGGAAPSTRLARGAPTSRQAEVTGQLTQSCGEDSKEVAGWPIDKIEQTVNPTADQRVLLDDFANASIRAAQAIKEACPTAISFAPTGRMDAMQKRIAGMVQAIDIVRQPLGRFYDALSDEQKARLNAATDQTDRSRSLAKLDALKNAMADAAGALSKACPTSLPATPPARLDAISSRLNTMLQSVSTVRGALDDFYNSLSDEQKAQFNRIGRQQQTAQQG